MQSVDANDEKKSNKGYGRNSTPKVDEAYRRGSVRVMPLSRFLRTELALPADLADSIMMDVDRRYKLRFCGQTFETRPNGPLSPSMKSSLADAAATRFQKEVGLGLGQEQRNLIADSIYQNVKYNKTISKTISPFPKSSPYFPIPLSSFSASSSSSSSTSTSTTPPPMNMKLVSDPRQKRRPVLSSVPSFSIRASTRQSGWKKERKTDKNVFTCSATPALGPGKRPHLSPITRCCRAVITSYSDFVWLFLWLGFTAGVFIWNAETFRQENPIPGLSSFSFAWLLVARGAALASIVSLFFLYIPVLRRLVRGAMMIGSYLSACTCRCHGATQRWKKKGMEERTAAGNQERKEGEDEKELERQEDDNQKKDNEGERKSNKLHSTFRSLPLSCIRMLPRLLPSQQHGILFHRLCGIVVVLMAWVHSIGWMLAISNWKSMTRQEYDASMIQGKLPYPVTFRGAFSSIAGATGLGMLFCVTIPLPFTMEWCRRRYFSLFSITHRLYVIFSLLFVVHGCGCHFGKWTGKILRRR